GLGGLARGRGGARAPTRACPTTSSARPPTATEPWCSRPPPLPAVLRGQPQPPRLPRPPGGGVRSRGVVGKRIVRVVQVRVARSPSRSPFVDVQALFVEDGIELVPVTIETE